MACGPQVVCGELSDALLDQLSALSSEVFLPLLSNRGNAEKALPEVVARGVADGMKKFVATGGQGRAQHWGGTRAAQGPASWHVLCF